MKLGFRGVSGLAMTNSPALCRVLLIFTCRRQGGDFPASYATEVGGSVVLK